MLAEVKSCDEEMALRVGPVFSLSLEKDAKERIGVGIGGGSGAGCPCLYVVQVFEGTPASRDEIISVGDEILAVNGASVRGHDKSSVATMIREAPSPVRITLKKFHLAFEQDPLQQFFDLDLVLKKFKHRLIDSVIDTKMADSLGLSRAVLVNDQLKQMQEKLNSSERLYKSLVAKLLTLNNAYKRRLDLLEEMGTLFLEVTSCSAGRTISDVGMKHNNKSSSFLIDALSRCHNSLIPEQSMLCQNTNKLICGLEAYLAQAIPDTKETLSKYLDAKYEYLSFCLKAKEMEDEETFLLGVGETLPRMVDGNVEYRVTLKLREESRLKFIKMRDQAIVKMELLEESRVRQMGVLMQSFLRSLKDAHNLGAESVRKCLHKHVELLKRQHLDVDQILK